MAESLTFSTTKWCMKCNSSHRSISCEVCHTQSPDILGHFFQIKKKMARLAEEPVPPHIEVKPYDVPLYGDNINSDNSVNDALRFDTAMASQVKDELKSIMDRMVAEEEEYVSALESTVKSYKSRMDTKRIAPLSEGDEDILFDTIEQIYEFHRVCFYPDLKSLQCSPLDVGGCFLKWKQHFHIYTTYNKNKPTADQLWNDIYFRSNDMNDGGKERKHSIDVGSYLLKPAQRLKEYVEVLNDLAYCCHSMDPRLKVIIDAHAFMEFQVRHADDVEVMESIENLDIKLEEQGCLLRQDEFQVCYGHYGVRKRTRKVFLFEKAVVFAKVKKQKGDDDGCLVYQHSIKTENLGLTETIGKSELKFELLHRKGKKGRLYDAYILQASSSILKKCWTNDIQRIQRISRKKLDIIEEDTSGSTEKINEVVRKETCDDIECRKSRLQTAGEFNENFVRENVFRRTTDVQIRRPARSFNQNDRERPSVLCRVVPR